MYKKLLFISIAILIANSCEGRKWYLIEQQPAEPYALLKDGVYVSGEYLRSAIVININDELVNKQNNSPIKVKIGMHQVTIYCDEAKGIYNSNKQDVSKYEADNTRKKTKTLTFNAKTERVYRVFCVPYTHWWIEDTELNRVVSGIKPEE